MTIICPTYSLQDWVTLRDETEWVETVEAGWNVLVGADKERIIDALCSYKQSAIHPDLYEYALFSKAVRGLAEQRLTLDEWCRK